MIQSDKTKLFIEKAKKVHGDRYDYSRVEYARSKDKVIISCHAHGEFEQRAGNHLAGVGCPKCGGTNRIDTKEWIEQARIVHGDSYDYSKVVYLNAKSKVTITCKSHGDFEQNSSNHIFGKGCYKCSVSRRGFLLSKSAGEMFTEKAMAIHGSNYDYSKVKYVNSKLKVTIHCPTHGYFKQTPYNHLSGRGCQACSGNKVYSTEEWVIKAKDVHGDRYDYSKSNYLSAKSNIAISCREHGDFEQEPSNHLSGKGCPQCPRSYDQPTYIYLLSNGEQVKIGISANVERRLRELNRDQPFTANLVHGWEIENYPKALRIERSIHLSLVKYNSRFSGYDGATEWFDITPDRAAEAISRMIEVTIATR